VLAKSYLPIIQELISRYHFDINARTKDGRSVLRLARTLNRNETITFLQTNGSIEVGDNYIRLSIKVTCMACKSLFQDHEITGLKKEASL
jgi:hypothetical protein